LRIASVVDSSHFPLGEPSIAPFFANADCISEMRSGVGAVCPRCLPPFAAFAPRFPVLLPVLLAVLLAVELPTDFAPLVLAALDFVAPLLVAVPAFAPLDLVPPDLVPPDFVAPAEWVDRLCFGAVELVVVLGVVAFAEERQNTSAAVTRIAIWRL